MRILVTRPPPGGPRTAARLRDLGHEAVEVPVMEVAPTGRHWPPGSFDAIVLTSANGLAGRPDPIAAAWAATPVIAVGKATAKAAATAGFAHITPAAGNATALAAEVASTLPRGARVLYLAGVLRKPDLEQALAAAGIAVTPVETYDARAVPPDRLARSLANRTPDAVLHYSRASAEAWLAGVRAGGLEDALLGGRHLALSPDVAEPLRRAGVRVLRVAERPEEDALLALLADRG
ncbi:uroporphyrinogen-III synthase [uncultured Alsobacter sp.]|uniref:uroporphyrinogen-III synthase n=1 Tax=uncultured Alsobacter sp. TaxID=1748258 RepID=UPI0025FFEE46|nr:uroporphyrinogen-III synthase [uncultured Alsobacter sp.]